MRARGRHRGVVIASGRTPLLVVALLLLAFGAYRFWSTAQLVNTGVVAPGFVFATSRSTLLIQVSAAPQPPRTIPVHRPWWTLLASRRDTVTIIYDPDFLYEGSFAFWKKARLHTRAALWLGPIFWTVLGGALLALYNASAQDPRVKANLEIRA
jgi:hypothetical protein